MMNEYREFLHQWTFLIGGLSVVLLYLIKWYSRPKKSPPGPYGLPVLGYLPFFIKNPEQTACKLSKKYGPIISIRLGTEDVVLLNDFDSIRKVFTQH